MDKKYTTIDLPFGVFKRALLDGDLSEVEDFESIFMEFNQAVGGKELEAELGKIKKEAVLRSRVTLASELIEVLQNNPEDAEAFEALKALRYHIKLPAPNLENALEYIKQIEGHVKYDISTLLSMESLRSQKPQEPVMQYSYDYFTDMVLDIQQCLDIKIVDTDPTRSYCRAVLRLKQHRERKIKEAA